MSESSTYYSISQAADTLKVSRQTIYNQIRSGKLKAIRVSERTIRIPADQFQEVQLRYADSPATTLNQLRSTMISKTDILNKYQIAKSEFYRKIKKAGLKAVRHGIETFYDKVAIDGLFHKNKYPEVTDWTTSEILSQEFGISRKRVCELARLYNIPRIRAGATMKISRADWIKHKLEIHSLGTQYITVQQAVNIYHIGKQTFYDQINANNIQKHRQGREVYFRKTELDKLFKEKGPKIPIDIKRKGLTTHQALKRYHIGMKRFLEETKTNNVEKTRTEGNFVYYNKEQLDKIFK